jgi:hypothetical protein
VMCLMRLNFLEYLGYGEDCGNGMRYKETACSTLHAVNHIVWGKSNPRELMQQFVKTLVLTEAFPGNLPGFFPSNPGKRPLHILSATIGSYRNPTG